MPLGAWSFRAFGTVWELALWELLIVVNGWMWHGVAQGVCYVGLSVYISVI